MEGKKNLRDVGVRMSKKVRKREVFEGTTHSCISHAQTNLHQERLVFVLEGEGEAIDNAAKDLKQLRNAVMRAGLVKHKPSRWNQINLDQTGSVE